jgi:hypothetical protein
MNSVHTCTARADDVLCRCADVYDVIDYRKAEAPEKSKPREFKNRSNLVGG